MIWCLLRCMSPLLAPNRPAGMSALWSLSGAKRTWLGLAESTRLTRTVHYPSGTPAKRMP